MAGREFLDALCPKSDYVFFDDDCVYLNWALMSPGLRGSTAGEDYARYRAAGPALFDRLGSLHAAVRRQAGEFFGYPDDCVFLTGNATSALETLQDLFKRQFASGWFLATDRSYASLVLALDGEFRNCTRWCEPTTRSFIDAVRTLDDPTMVVLEGQEYRAGSRYDIVRIAVAVAERRTAGVPLFLLVDASQWPAPDWGFGEFVSYVVSGANWAGGASGCAFGLAAPLLELESRHAGWGSLNGQWTYPIHRNFKETASRLDACGGGKPWLPLSTCARGWSMRRVSGGRGSKSTSSAWLTAHASNSSQPAFPSFPSRTRVETSPSRFRRLRGRANTC